MDLILLSSVEWSKSIKLKNAPHEFTVWISAVMCERYIVSNYQEKLLELTLGPRLRAKIKTFMRMYNPEFQWWDGFVDCLGVDHHHSAAVAVADLSAVIHCAKMVKEMVIRI